MKQISRCRAVCGLVLCIIVVPLPLFTALNKIPWRYISYEYFDWWQIVLKCWRAAIGTSEGQIRR